MRQWFVCVTGTGNDGLKATFEALVNADSAIDAMQIANNNVHSIYWRDTAYKIEAKEIDDKLEVQHES